MEINGKATADGDHNEKQKSVLARFTYHLTAVEDFTNKAAAPVVGRMTTASETKICIQEVTLYHHPSPH